MVNVKFCRYCGGGISEYARFCNKCGRALTGVPQSQSPAPPSHAPPSIIDNSSLLDDSYRQSGHVVLTPFRKTVINGTVCYTGTTRHPNGHSVDVRIYLMNSFAHAQGYKEQLLRSYEAHEYTRYKIEHDMWVGSLGGTLVTIMAKETSVLGVPTTMVISTPL